MPKKFKGENSKAVEARSRQEAAKQAEKDKVQKAKDDEFWKDDDKHLARKNQRKEEKESKRLEQLERKKELQSLHDDEMASIKGAAKVTAVKVTRAQIEEQLDRKQSGAMKTKPVLSHLEEPLVENLNRLQVEGDEARTVDEAISVMGNQDPAVDRHPEKRVKAAYAEFEAQRLPVLKEENSNMRLSKLKQILKKEWLKSPDNPLNQRTSSYNTKC